MFKSKKKRKKLNGATLVEVVIAALILAIAFLPTLRVVDYGSVNTAKIGHYAKATRLAQNLVEECKHVPFKVYQVTYKDLGNEESFDVHPEFYKDTGLSIDHFRDETKDKVKEFNCKASLKAKKNDLDQISEIWFEVEISWYDMGNLSDARGEKRVVKAGNAYFNPEAF